MSGWSGGRTVVAVPTTGHSASSIFCAWGSLTVFLSAGHDVAVVLLLGTGGCDCRLWWWSVVAPTTGHCASCQYELDARSVVSGTYNLAIFCEVDGGVVGREDIVGGSDYWARHGDGTVSLVRLCGVEGKTMRGIATIKRCICFKASGSSCCTLSQVLAAFDLPQICRDHDANSVVSFIISSLIGREPNS
jgi:hypothetical protein